jgi:hypothetical protein
LRFSVNFASSSSFFFSRALLASTSAIAPFLSASSCLDLS